MSMTEGEELNVIELDQGDGWTRVRRMSEFEEGFSSLEEEKWRVQCGNSGMLSCSVLSLCLPVHMTDTREQQPQHAEVSLCLQCPSTTAQAKLLVYFYLNMVHAYWQYRKNTTMLCWHQHTMYYITLLFFSIFSFLSFLNT
ncbi:Formin-binding protein 1 [Portunus trituberculatus]|uniref:Formin-binding protein 1 n=1 Tax=Portunus trituberculatus TaxID=210409 RepID=A0A5B7IK67_PORTR|nr:Formin-binding protein 1 [Portunus trituberculatus]